MSEVRPRTCAVCGHDRFGAGSFVVLRGIVHANLDRISDFPNHVCDAHVCLSCGYVMWFAREPRSLLNGHTADVRAVEDFIEEPSASTGPYRGPAANAPRQTVPIDAEGAQAIKVISVLCQRGGLQLAEARQALWALPYRIRCRSAREAQLLRKALRDAGAAAELE